MSQTVLKLNDIVKKYQDGESERVILNHINLEVHEGEFVAIVGPSGCGKSTLLNIAGMMLSSDHGDITLCGEKVSALPKKKWTDIRKENIFFLILKPENSLRPYSAQTHRKSKSYLKN